MRLRHHNFFGQLRVASSDSPVSNKLLRLARILGHPPDTASMSFDRSQSISCVIVSLIESITGSSSIVQREKPSTLSSGLNSFRHDKTIRFGFSISSTLPLSAMVPSGSISFQDEPVFQSQSCQDWYQ